MSKSLFEVTKKIGSGSTPKGGQNSNSTEGIAFIRSQNILDFKFSTNGLTFIDTIQALELKNVIIEENDILLNITGDSIARCCLVPKSILPARVSQHVSIIRANSDVDSNYLLYYLQYLKPYLLKICGVGGTRNALTKKALEELRININSKHKEIGKILSTLDAKIELNNRINAQLEAMAKTIYDYWFVQFDFPDANGKPYKSNGGKMVWNEELKRSVPEGWEVGTLSDIANITMGQSPPGESYNEERIGTVFYQGCTDFGTRYPSVRKYTDSPTRFAKQGDILLSVRAPVGTMNIANENCCIGRGLAALNSKNNSISFLYGAMNNLKQIFDRRNNDGTTFGSITKDDLFSLQVIIPPTEIVNQFDKKLYTSFEKQNNIEQQNQQLSSLRDWLLPMLMNGQVSVGE